MEKGLGSAKTARQKWKVERRGGWGGGDWAEYLHGGEEFDMSAELEGGNGGALLDRSSLHM